MVLIRVHKVLVGQTLRHIRSYIHFNAITKIAFITPEVSP
jgi:hypothetical protein